MNRRFSGRSDFSDHRVYTAQAPLLRLLYILLAALCPLLANAGDSTDCRPVTIFYEDFGSGALNPGPELPPGATTYCYEDLTGSCLSGGPPEVVDDGSYSILNDPEIGLIIPGLDSSLWLSHVDHTPFDTNGYMLVVNADFEPGEYYRVDNITVIEGSEYSFSAWFNNILTTTGIGICSFNEAPVNVEFRVEDAVTGTVLGAFSTGDLFATGALNWVQGRFDFRAISPVINVVMVNNAEGGCGNDFAIDDILLEGCAGNTTLAVNDTLLPVFGESADIDILLNDSDPQGDQQAVTGLSADTDGDLIPDTGVLPGEVQPVGGLDDYSGPTDFAGTVTVSTDGSFEFIPTVGFTGQVQLLYFICDDGIPVVCDSAWIIIIVPPDVPKVCPVPDVITPNGDGFNDVLVIPCAPRFPEMELLIYNRWGNQVYFSGTGYDNSWDGTWSKNGKPLPDGTYFFIVRFFDTANTTAAGDVLLLR